MSPVWNSFPFNCKLSGAQLSCFYHLCCSEWFIGVNYNYSNLSFYLWGGSINTLCYILLCDLLLVWMKHWGRMDLPPSKCFVLYVRLRKTVNILVLNAVGGSSGTSVGPFTRRLLSTKIAPWDWRGWTFVAWAGGKQRYWFLTTIYGIWKYQISCFNVRTITKHSNKGKYLTLQHLHRRQRPPGFGHPAHPGQHSSPNLFPYPVGTRVKQSPGSEYIPINNRLPACGDTVKDSVTAALWGCHDYGLKRHRQ